MESTFKACVHGTCTCVSVCACVKLLVKERPVSDACKKHSRPDKKKLIVVLNSLVAWDLKIAWLPDVHMSVCASVSVYLCVFVCVCAAHEASAITLWIIYLKANA